MTHRTSTPARAAATSEYIGRLRAEIARRQTYFDALADSPWDLLVLDADAALKRAWQRLEVAAGVLCADSPQLLLYAPAPATLPVRDDLHHAVHRHT